MKQWRALWAAMALWAFLGWMYIIMRILGGIDPLDEFIAGIPVTFWVLGIGAYVLGFVATWRALVDG